MAEFINALDPASLTLLQAGVALVLSPFSFPSYNLPVFLYGLYTLEKADSFEPLRIFTGFVGTSFFLDIFWFFTETGSNQSGFLRFLTILNLLLKIPTFFALLVSLRRRGDPFGDGLHRRGPVESSTVWSMPGTYQAAGGDLGESTNINVAPAAGTTSVAPPPPIIRDMPVPVHDTKHTSPALQP